MEQEEFEELANSIDNKHFILIGQTVVPVDWRTCAEWYEESSKDGRRIVKQQDCLFGLCMVSTVFLCNHNWGPGPPDIFETMLFWRGEGCEQLRCSTWMEAEEQHRRMVRCVYNPITIFRFLMRTLKVVTKP